MEIRKGTKWRCKNLLKDRFRRGFSTGKEKPMAAWAMEQSFVDTYILGHSSWRNIYDRVKREAIEGRRVESTFKILPHIVAVQI